MVREHQASTNMKGNLRQQLGWSCVKSREFAAFIKTTKVGLQSYANCWTSVLAYTNLMTKHLLTSFTALNTSSQAYEMALMLCVSTRKHCKTLCPIMCGSMVVFFSSANVTTRVAAQTPPTNHPPFRPLLYLSFALDIRKVFREFIWYFGCACMLVAFGVEMLAWSGSLRLSTCHQDLDEYREKYYREL